MKTRLNKYIVTIIFMLWSLFAYAMGFAKGYFKNPTDYEKEVDENIKRKYFHEE